MSLVFIDFDRKWNGMISLQTEENHRNAALYNHLATIATAVSFIALTVICSIALPEIASVVFIGVAFLITPAIETAQFFLEKARESKKLQNQGLKVRSIYQKLFAKKTVCAESKAFSTYWNIQAKEAQKNYNTLYENAINKAKDPKISLAGIKRSRQNALDAQRDASAIQIRALFIEAVSKQPILFQKLFAKYGQDLPNLVSELGIWDLRESEKRCMDSFFKEDDNILVFNNRSIDPISYSEVFNESKRKSLKERLLKAVKEKTPS